MRKLTSHFPVWIKYGAVFGMHRNIMRNMNGSARNINGTVEYSKYVAAITPIKDPVPRTSAAMDPNVPRILKRIVFLESKRIIMKKTTGHRRFPKRIIERLTQGQHQWNRKGSVQSEFHIYSCQKQIMTKKSTIERSIYSIP